MSHISVVSIQIKDLNALKMAVQRMGALFIENKKTYEWYGRSMGDGSIPAGMTVADLGKCDHVIKLPGVRYEVGVVKMATGGYTLAWDEYDYKPQGHDGGKLIERFGQGLKKLTQNYAACVATMAAKAKGWIVQEQQLPNGSIKIVCSGMR